MTKDQAVIGSRILYRVDHENLPGLLEGKVKEVTPGGNVKLGERWHRLDHVNLVETLDEPKRVPKAETTKSEAAAATENAKN